MLGIFHRYYPTCSNSPKNGTRTAKIHLIGKTLQEKCQYVRTYVRLFVISPFVPRVIIHDDVLAHVFVLFRSLFPLFLLSWDRRSRGDDVTRRVPYRETCPGFLIPGYFFSFSVVSAVASPRFVLAALFNVDHHDRSIRLASPASERELRFTCDQVVFFFFLSSSHPPPPLARENARDTPASLYTRFQGIRD